MKKPIYIEAQGPSGEWCGSNCPFLMLEFDQGFCTLFAEHLEDMTLGTSSTPLYDRDRRCLLFDQRSEE